MARSGGNVGTTAPVGDSLVKQPVYALLRSVLDSAAVPALRVTTAGSRLHHAFRAGLLEQASIFGLIVRSDDLYGEAFRIIDHGVPRPNRDPAFPQLGFDRFRPPNAGVLKIVPG